MFALIRKGGDALGDVRVRLEIDCDLSLPLRLQKLVDIGVEIILGDWPIAHFTLLSFNTFRDASPAVPSISCCSLSRARDRRDITVPIGILRTFAASA